MRSYSIRLFFFFLHARVMGKGVANNHSPIAFFFLTVEISSHTYSSPLGQESTVAHQAEMNVKRRSYNTFSHYQPWCNPLWSTGLKTPTNTQLLPLLLHVLFILHCIPLNEQPIMTDVILSNTCLKQSLRMHLCISDQEKNKLLDNVFA